MIAPILTRRGCLTDAVIRRARAWNLFTVFMVAPILAEGQTATAGSGAPGDLALVDFSSWSLGPVAPGRRGPLQVVDGTLAIVDHQNQRMLRASSRSTVVLSLPTALPRDFTLEFDLVPKECCQPEDIAIEGTTTINQGPSSANVQWWHGAIRVVGGGGGFDKPMLPSVAVALPGALTSVMLTFRGDELTVYTNGQLIYTIPNTLFVRGFRSAVLRVFLGGQNDTDRAVYLARFRVAQGALTPTPVVAAPNVAAAAALPGATQSVGRTGPAGLTSAQTTAGAATGAGNIAKSFNLPGFAGAGSTGIVRTFTLAAIVASGATSPASRTFTTAGFTATGASASASRTFDLAGFSASGGSGSPMARTFDLAGFIASGAPPVISRTFSLTGWTASAPP